MLDKKDSVCYTIQALREQAAHRWPDPLYRGVEQLAARRAHNPEVVGSSPASATIKSPEIARFRDFFLRFSGRKVRRKIRNYLQNRLTHVLTHNRIAPSGQSSIFQNTISSNSEKQRNFQNFLKRKSYDLRVFHSMFKTSPMPTTGTGRGFSSFFVG